MASHLSVSLSDSVQASLILQSQQRRRQRHEGRQMPQDDNDDNDDDDDPTKGLSLCVQFLLVFVFAGIEMSATFTLIYNVLFLQYVNVPTSMLSMPGIICGSTTIILLPVIGWFAGRGSNPVTRKMKLMLISLAAYTIGYVCLAICSASKLHSSQIANHYGNVTRSERAKISPATTLYQLTSTDTTEGFLVPLVSKKVSANITDFNQNTPDVISYISILSLALLDIGFDASSSLCRAFVLECTPPSLHSRILVLATIFSSVAGVTFSLVGTIDFPGMLASMFKVDGTAATVIMFSFFMTTFLVGCFTCTMITGYMVAKRTREVKQQYGHLDLESIDSACHRTKPRLFNKFLWRRSKLTKDASTSTDPLLWPSRPVSNNRSYSSLSATFEGENISDQKTLSAEKPQHQRVLSQWEMDDPIIYEDEPLTNKTKYNNQDCDNNDAKEGYNDEAVISQSVSEFGSVSDDEDEVEVSDEYQSMEGPIPTILSAIKASYSMSLSMAHSSMLVDAQSRKTKRDGPTQINDKNLVLGKSIWKNSRLRILCVSIFFACGAMLLFSEYNSNGLTIGIYHGDPKALPGTPGKQLYEKGLRGAALGNLVMYLGYTGLTLLNRKVIDIIGEKPQFIACHVAFTGILVSLVLVESQELYYLSCAISGFQRACSFTLGYILAHKIVHEECPETGDPNTLRRTVGQVMVLIGFLMPSQYLLSSSIVGPLLSATGNVWVPLIMGSVFSAISALVMCLLYIVKPNPF